MSREPKIWSENIENQFSEGLREMLSSAQDGFQQSSDIPIGITTSRLFLAALYLGKHRPNNEPFLSTLYHNIGENETAQMEARLNQLGIVGEEVYDLKARLPISISELAQQIIEKAVSKKSPSREVATPVDVLVTLAEKLSTDIGSQSDCSILLPRSRLFPSELISWLNIVASDVQIPRDLLNRLQVLRGSKLLHQQPPTRREKDSNAFVRQSPTEWQRFLGNQYQADFDLDTAVLVQAAARSVVSQSLREDEIPILNTKDFLVPLTDKGPLNGLILGSFIGGFSGRRPPWYEEVAKSEDLITANTPLENTRLSFDSHDCLRAAAFLVKTTLKHPKVTPWHFTVALLSSKTTGFSWYLDAHRSSFEQAAETLLKNMREKSPALFNERNWAELLGVPALQKTPSIAANPDQDTASAFDERDDANDSSVTIGAIADYSRDSNSSQIDSETKKLARAIASTFKSTNTGDFCFGLFGPWGRGKTTLIREVASELSEDHVTVTFNAWKFPTRPEVWVSLYETIKAKASGTDVLNRLRIGIQSNLRADRGVGFLFSGFLLLLAGISKNDLTNRLIPLESLAAILAIMLLVFYSYRLWNSFGTLLRDYLKMPNHGRHLGLQATIGEDLKRLLATWIGIDPHKVSNSDNEKIAEELPVSNLKYFKKLSLRYWPFTVGIGSVIVSLSFIIYRVWIPASWLLLTILIVLAASLLIGFFCVLFPPKRAKKILLIIDDLDRCPPEEMLSVIESLRVFLDDAEIWPHLKIAMLLDREILSHAIFTKYKNLIQNDVSNKERDGTSDCAPTRFSRDGIIAEQLEKYFILSFDMPPLASASSWKIAASIIGCTDFVEESSPHSNSYQWTVKESNFIEGQGMSSNASNSKVEITKQLDDFTVETSENKSPRFSAEVKLESLPEVHEVRLSHDEKKAMMELLHSLITTEPAHATPRRMRMTMLRYFLARQILIEQGIAFKPDDLLKHFSGLWIDRKLDLKLAEVVGMVTGKAPEK